MLDRRKMPSLRRQPADRMLYLVFLLAGTVASAVDNLEYPCKPPFFNSFPFCNASLPIRHRAHSLVKLLTLREKIQQLSNTAAAVPRLGLPAYQWWSESLHGVATNGPGVLFNGTIRASTLFPQVILSAAAFNRSLWRATARAIAIEARAMRNVGQAGLTFWAPNINIFRDPRWGRGQETPGEDPYLTSLFSIDYVSAFQAQASKLPGGSIMLSACCKHYTAYDLDKWKGFNRYTFNAQVTEQDMEDTFQPPFRSCIEEGGASCLMCSDNQINGVPSCANKHLIDKARGEWGFQGYVASDCDAVSIIYEAQKYARSPEDAVADVLKAGMDINCGTYLLRHTEMAVKQGKVSEEEDVDRALINLFSVQLRLGLFDGNPKKLQYGNLGPQDVCTKQHREIALEAARQGLVLLKNAMDFLPLRKHNVSSLALIGPAANKADLLGGGYSGIPCNPITFFDGLRHYVPSIHYAAGCANTSCLTADGFDEAARVAGAADVVVMIAGLNLTEETEDHDRVTLQLPGKQRELVNAVALASKKPLILVLMGGGPLDVSFAKEDHRIGSILWIGYPGEVAGQVLAEALFGEFNPGGALPVTWYPESFTAVPMNDMNMRANPSRGYPGRTYRFYEGETVYDFGYGLSYTNYSYRFLSAPNELRLPVHSSDAVHLVQIDESISCPDWRFNVRILVENEGNVDGSHAVLVFVSPRKRMEGWPKKQLVGFERVFVAAHRAAEIRVTVDICKQLGGVDGKGKRVLALGAHVLMVGHAEHVVLLSA